ncbi:MAG: NAD(P)H-dependent oxidoreductase [Kofleriaceae bacterium]
MVALLGICGSERKSSLNRALLVAVGQTLPDGATLSIWDSLELPIFNSDHPEPGRVVALKQAIAAADGIVFGVPEYNYSIPGGLKNALDWVSRPLANAPLRGKPIGLVGAASGMSGTIRAQAHLRQILLFSDAQILSQPEVLIPRAHELSTRRASSPTTARAPCWPGSARRWSHSLPGTRHNSLR